jgi:PIN domain nuclease of toxin-antitoxin system
LLEVACLSLASKITLNTSLDFWIENSLKIVGALCVSITKEIAIESYSLPGVFHKDPADRIIVATARLENAILITEDDKILNYAQQGHVQVLQPS